MEEAYKLIDISQEVFSCRVFPGDPAPERTELKKITDGDVCNLTAISMCAHNGTHVDSPYHFYADGEAIDKVGLDRFIGYAFVAAHEGDITAEDAERILREAKQQSEEAARRILIKGKAVLTSEAAQVLAKEGILLYGNESQTVGPEDAPREVHLIMLGAKIVLLEGIRLENVPEGVYLLHAAPINLGGADGAPCRATLLKI